MTEVTTAKLDAPITFIPGFLGPETANEAFAALLAEFPWERHTSNMHGKVVAVPRMEVWVADHPYTYSRRTYQPAPWTPTLVKIKNDIEADVAVCPEADAHATECPQLWRGHLLSCDVPLKADKADAQPSCGLTR